MRHLIAIGTLLILSGGVFAQQPSQADWCEYSWDADKPVPSRLNLPGWACAVVNDQKLSQKYSPAVEINPFFLMGDFDGDHQTDIAIRIKNKQSGKYGLAIIHSKSRKPFLIGAGKPSDRGDNLNWFDMWTQIPKQKLESPFEEHPAMLIGDAILLIKSESASVALYWNGKDYEWFQIDD